MPGTCEERKDVRLEEEGMEGSGVPGKGQQKPGHAHAELPMLGISTLLVFALALRPLWI